MKVSSDVPQRTNLFRNYVHNSFMETKSPGITAVLINLAIKGQSQIEYLFGSSLL